MKQIIYILPILVFLVSCKNEFKKNISEIGNNSEPPEVTDYNADFNKWLDELDVDRDNIVDTTIERAFELWTYRDKLTKSDSTFYWYPSKDSSYYLITNINQKSKNRISTKISNDIYLRFLNRSKEEVHNGVILLDSLQNRTINFYWYDPTTFFFIENQDEEKEKTLTKLKMGINSIWVYKIEK